MQHFGEMKKKKDFMDYRKTGSDYSLIAVVNNYEEFQRGEF